MSKMSKMSAIVCDCLRLSAMPGYVRLCPEFSGVVWYCSALSGIVRRCLVLFVVVQADSFRASVHKTPYFWTDGRLKSLKAMKNGTVSPLFATFLD